MLFAWGNASIAALEAMWRGRSLWRMLHKIHQQGLAGFFTEINTLPQRPDLLAAGTSRVQRTSHLPNNCALIYGGHNPSAYDWNSN